MVPLPYYVHTMAIYTISVKYGRIKQFKTIFCWFILSGPYSTSVFLILNISIFMVLGVTQNCLSIFLCLAVFQILNFITFGTWMLSVNAVFRVPFRLFKFNNILLQHQWKYMKEFSGIFRSWMYLNIYIHNPPRVDFGEIGNLPHTIQWTLFPSVVQTLNVLKWLAF